MPLQTLLAADVLRTCKARAALMASCAESIALASYLPECVLLSPLDDKGAVEVKDDGHQLSL